MSKEKIKIGFFCDGEWGLNTLNLILKKKNYKIQFVCTRYAGDIKKKYSIFVKKKKFNILNSKILIVHQH